MAERLHVKLMQIIVNSCCPSVPVNSTIGRTNNRETSIELHQGRVVLNYSPRRPSSVIRHPEVAVREILTKLVQLMKGKFLSGMNTKTVCFCFCLCTTVDNLHLCTLF